MASDIDDDAIERITAERSPHYEPFGCSRKFISHLNPPGKAVDIPYEPGKPICGYFVRAPIFRSAPPCPAC